MTASPTVFVVDDDPSVRRAIARLIQSVGHPVEAFPGGAEFLAGFDRSRPGCLVLDVRMPHTSGLDLQQKLLSEGCELPVIFITGHGDVPTSVRAMKAGAVDFIQKPFGEQDLLDAVKRAIERDAKLREARAQQESVARRIELLTPREREVFALVVAGHLNKEIARQLGTAEKTVKAHRGHVMQKMEAGSVAELVMLAQAAGLTTTKVSVIIDQ